MAEPAVTGATPLDWTLARAATIVIVLILAHSFVDYPLRTEAMMVIMAFACALLIEPAEQASRTEPERVKHSPERQKGAANRRALASYVSSVQLPCAHRGRPKSDVGERTSNGLTSGLVSKQSRSG